MAKPQGLSLFNSKDHQAIVDFYDTATIVRHCTKGCKVAADCDRSCKKWEMVVMFILLFVFQSFAQTGSKGTYTTKKPVTEESLTKNAVVFDVFTETGKKVYYQLKTKKDGSTEDYYFTVVERKDKQGNIVLTRKKVFKQ